MADRVEALEALYESTLRGRLHELEQLRRPVRGYAIRVGLLVGVPVVLLFLNPLTETALPPGLAWMATAVPFVGVFAGLIVAAFKYIVPGFAAYGNYRTRFKQEIAAEVFGAVCPGAQYSPHDGIAEAVFDAPGLFNRRGGFRSDDRVTGRIGQTPFEAAEVRRAYATGGKNSTTFVVFHGLFFHLDFARRLRGVTVVDPHDASAVTTGDRSALSRVTLGDAAFDARFTVHASEPTEAADLLSPEMRARILSLTARTSRPVHLAFADRRAYIGVHYGRALFEPGIASTTSLDALREMAAHFGLADAIVHELGLNTRVSSPEADGATLVPAPAPPPDPVAAAMRRGDLTPEQLWAVAVAAGGGDVEGPAIAPRPASTAIAIDREGQQVVVRYGLSAGFWIAVVFWATATAIALAAARTLPAAVRMPELAPAVAWIPVVPYASPLVTSAPVVWLIVSSVVASFAFLMWAVRVRTVAIAPDAVRIWRGLRPLPRTYPRPLYGKVVRIEQAVYIGKTTGLSLVNPTASPMLSEEEAAWVAAEMRRALGSTAPVGGV